MDKWNFVKYNYKLINAIILFFVCLTFNNISHAQTYSAVQSPSDYTNTYAAPEIQGISSWINSSPLSLQSLRGKVVLLEFWSYSCVYCYYSMPYLNDWYNKYSSQGLVIIGIHNFEDPNDRDVTKVEQVVQTYGMKYPIALDNNSVMWRIYKPRYWPSTFLIDKNGNIVYKHIGQGAYGIIENNIRSLLSQNASG